METIQKEFLKLSPEKREVFEKNLRFAAAIRKVIKQNKVKKQDVCAKFDVAEKDYDLFVSGVYDYTARHFNKFNTWYQTT